MILKDTAETLRGPVEFNCSLVLKDEKCEFQMHQKLKQSNKPTNQKKKKIRFGLLKKLYDKSKGNMT